MYSSVGDNSPNPSWLVMRIKANTMNGISVTKNIIEITIKPVVTLVTLIVISFFFFISVILLHDLEVFCGILDSIPATDDATISKPFKFLDLSRSYFLVKLWPTINYFFNLFLK